MEKLFRQVRAIPKPMKGVSSLSYIDRILKHRNISGVLIGGLSELLWTNPKQGIKNKDVDIFLLGGPTETTPGQWESGVDWWLQSSKDFAPSNGTHICLCWRFLVRDNQVLEPGLYLPSREIIEEYRECESGVFIRNKGFTTLKDFVFEGRSMDFKVITNDILCVEKIELSKPSRFPKPITY